MDSGFGGLDRQPVHHLDGRRNNAGADDLRHRGARCLGRFECRQDRLDGLGSAENAQCDFRDDRERAFRSDQRAEEIDSGRVQRRPAQVHHLAVGQHRLDAEHVVHRESVLQAMRAAGVFRDVAANRADQLARRIGCVVVAVRRNAPGHVEVDDPGLDGDALIGNIHIDDAVQARQSDQHAIRPRQRAARQSRAVAARDKRNLVRVAQTDDLLNLFGACRAARRIPASLSAERARRIRR